MPAHTGRGSLHRPATGQKQAEHNWSKAARMLVMAMARTPLLLRPTSCRSALSAIPHSMCAPASGVFETYCWRLAATWDSQCCSDMSPLPQCRRKPGVSGSDQPQRRQGGSCSKGLQI